MERQRDGQLDKHIDQQTEKRMDGWIDRKKDQIDQIDYIDRLDRLDRLDGLD